MFADYDGENLFGQNFCQKVDRYNFTNITSISFVTSNLVQSGNNYTYSVVVVGYPSVPTLRGVFNGRSIGTDAMTPFKCPKKYANGASADFNAGRIIEWYIPASYVTSSNSIIVTVQDKTASKSGIKAPTREVYGLGEPKHNDEKIQEGNPCNPIQVNLKEEIREDIEKQLEQIANPVEAEIVDTGYTGYLFEDKYSCQSMPIDVNDMQ